MTRGPAVMKTLPEQVVAYQRTPEFTAATVPAGLLKAHSTKPGVWGTLVVLEGALTYRILEPTPSERRLTPGHPGVIEPTVLHEVVPEPAVRFYVEFHR